MSGSEQAEEALPTWAQPRPGQQNPREVRRASTWEAGRRRTSKPKEGEVLMHDPGKDSEGLKCLSLAPFRQCAGRNTVCHKHASPAPLSSSNLDQRSCLRHAKPVMPVSRKHSELLSAARSGREAMLGI